MTRNILFLFLSLTAWINSNAQSVFEKSYPVEINNAFSYISQLKLLPDSSYLFSTTAYDNSDNFLLLGRIDHLGNVDWIKQINDSFQISQANFALSANNELYLTYSARNGNPPRNYSVVLKMDLSGNLNWSKSYGDSTRTHACEHIFLTPTSIFLAGECYSSTPSDLYLIKLDTAGNFNWGKTYEAGGIDYLRDAKQLNNQDILLSGLTRDSVNHYFNSLFRIDTTGTIAWHKRFYLPSYKEFNSQALLEDYDGTLLITGHADTVEVSSATYFGKWDISIMRLTATGNFLWGKIMGGSDFDEVWQVLSTDDHGFIFAAEPESFGNVSRISLMKTDNVANIQWMKLYGKTTGGFPNNIVINHDKGFTILATDGDYNVNAPMLFIRTDSLGISICPESVVTLPQLPFTPLEDTIGGYGMLSGTLPYIPVISNYPLDATDYCNPVFIFSLSADYFLQVYPNPFSSFITLSLNKQGLRKLKITIQNTLGQTVYKSEEPNLTNSFTTSIDMTTYAKGIYLIDLTIDGERTTRKIIKQ
jgi:hypothetical protein